MAVSDEVRQRTLSKLRVVGEDLPDSARSAYINWDVVYDFAQNYAGEWIRVKQYKSQAGAYSVRRKIMSEFPDMDVRVTDQRTIYVRVHA